MTHKEVWMLVEAEVPALGYTTLYIEPEEGSEEVTYPDSAAQLLENNYARLRLGKGGKRVSKTRLAGWSMRGPEIPFITQ